MWGQEPPINHEDFLIHRTLVLIWQSRKEHWFTFKQWGSIGYSLQLLHTKWTIGSVHLMVLLHWESSLRREGNIYRLLKDWPTPFFVQNGDLMWQCITSVVKD